ncbi:MAG TPA: hypothetical protein VF418_12640 [Sphingomonadaceae bacterium]
MKRLITIGALAFAAVALAGCAHDGRHHLHGSGYHHHHHDGDPYH